MQPVTSVDCGSQHKQPADLAVRDHPSAWRWVCISLLLCCSTALASEPTQLDKLLKEGLAFHDRKDYTHAIPILQRAVEVSPRNYLANMLLGVDLLRSGKAADAIVHLQIAVSTDPGDQSAAEALAKAATEAGNFSMAAEVLQTSVKRSNGMAEPVQALAGFSLERFRVLGDMLRSTKRGEGVELRFEAASHAEGSSARASLLQEAAKANPDQRGIWGELGVAQLELRNRTGVEASLREADQREPDGAETLQLEALLAAVEGRWPDAEMLLRTLGGRSRAALKRVLRKWVPSLVPGNGVQGAVWDCLRNPESQCPLTSELPRSGEGLNAESLYAQGRWEQLLALPQSGKAGQSDGLWRGVALAETGDCEKAISSLERGMGTAGEEYGIFWLEVCYADEVERAEELLGDTEDKAAQYQLRGDVSLRMSLDGAKAEEQYAEALKLRPNDPQLLERSAEALVALAQMDQARKQVLAALAIDPDQDSALRLLAEIEISDRDYKEAIAPLKQLSVQHPADMWPRVQLGRTYAQLGQSEQALHYLEPALTSGYPDPKGALHATLSKVLRQMGREEAAKQAAIEAARLADAAQESRPGDAHESK